MNKVKWIKWDKIVHKLMNTGKEIKLAEKKWTNRWIKWIYKSALALVRRRRGCTTVDAYIVVSDITAEAGATRTLVQGSFGRQQMLYHLQRKGGQDEVDVHDLSSRTQQMSFYLATLRNHGSLHPSDYSLLGRVESTQTALWFDKWHPASSFPAWF